LDVTPPELTQVYPAVPCGELGIYTIIFSKDICQTFMEFRGKQVTYLKTNKSQIHRSDALPLPPIPAVIL
jgi:hypothetical protein